MQIEPDQNLDMLITRARENHSSGHHREAERLYRQCLTIDPAHLGAMINLGNLIFDAGQLRIACELYRAATRAHPGAVIAWYNLGNALDELGFRDAAVEALGHAIRVEPDYADAHFNIALILEKLDKRSAARRHWQTYLELAPTGESAQTAQAFLDA